MRNTIWIHIVVLISFGHIKAQVHDRYPSSYQQYYNHLRLINPAALTSVTRLELAGGNQFLTGDFNNIGSYNASTAFTVMGNDSSLSKQALGINLLGEREGSIFSNTRVYVAYALRRKLSATYALSMGISTGLASYMVQATPNSGGGSAQAFDGGIGLSLSNTRLTIAAALNQFTNSTVSPLVEQLVLRRYVEAYGQYLWDLSPSLQLKSLVHGRLQSNLQPHPDLTEILLWRELFAVGMSYTLQRQYGFIVGLERLPVLKGNIKAYFSFHMPVSRIDVAQNTNTVVLGLSYSLARDQTLEVGD